MICPNCGNVLDEIVIKCDYCGYEMTKNTKKDNNTPEITNNVLPTSNDSNRETPNQIPPTNWVGPRRVAHICSIIAGIQMIYHGVVLYMLMGLESFFASLNSGMEAGVWCILFGIILIILGIVGLVKIHSGICCIILSVLYALAVLPFTQYKYLVVPRTDIFIAVCVSLAAMALCGAAYTVKGGVASGWITLVILIGIIIFGNVNYDEKQSEYNISENEMAQSGNDDKKWVQATATPVPTELPQSVYNGQELLYDYDEDASENGESEEYESEDNEDSDYIFSDSDTEYITKTDVKGMSAKELNLAKNELYARHGRIFDREDLQDYFESCSWYEPLYTREEWDEKGDKYFFNKVEIKNRNFLVKRERKAKK